MVCDQEVDYRQLFHNSPNAYLLITPELILADVNESYLALLRRKREDIMGRHLFDVFPPQSDSQGRQISASISSVVRSGRPHSLGALHYPVQQTVGCEAKWENHYWHVTNVPLLNDDGKVSHVLNFIQDVTSVLLVENDDDPIDNGERVEVGRVRRAQLASKVGPAIESELRRLRQLMEQTPGFVAVGRGPDHVIELANRAYYQLVGHREMIGKSVREALPELEGQGFYELLDQVYTSGEPFVGRAMPILFQRTPGSALTQRYIDFIYQPIFEDDGQVSGIFVQGHDVTEAYLLTQEFNYQASHCELTGLYNRREFERQLAQAVKEARAGSGNHALLYLDLDQFKIVNDTCGHAAGDGLLRLVGMTLAERVPADAVLARLGGDEFAVLMHSPSTEFALAKANMFRELVHGIEFSWGSRVFGCSASIGVIIFGKEEESLDQVLSAADSACYLAKEKGRNRVQLFTRLDKDLVERKRGMDWVGRIRDALRDDRFKLYGQKIVPLKAENESREHIEVLLRMLDEDGEIIPPGAFIPAAERYNLMPLLDRMVISRVLGLVERCSNPPLVSINLSGTTLNDPEFRNFLSAQLKLRKVAPEGICFEITETAAVSNIAHTVTFLRHLKSVGFRFSLDDFGSGMSSFGYLKALPVDFLKIDGVFIRHLLSDAADEAMVRSISAVAGVMGIRTIAEYVECEGIREKLCAAGVDYAQGYALHVPCLLEDELFQRNPIIGETPA